MSKKYEPIKIEIFNPNKANDEMQETYSMRRLSDTDHQRDINYSKEYLRIEDMFKEDLRNGYCLKKIMDKSFKEWGLRGRYISLDDMKIGLGIMDYDKMVYECTLPMLVTYIQFILNCLNYIQMESDYETYSIYLESQVEAIRNNANNILDTLNYAAIEDEENNEIYVVDKSPISTAVSENYPDIKESVIEYRRHDFHGNLKRKAEILCTLWKKYEPIREILVKNNLSKLDDQIGILFNDLIRHNKIEGKRANTFVRSMADEQLEFWYDKAYDLFLLAMMHTEYINIKPALVETINNINEGKK